VTERKPWAADALDEVYLPLIGDSLAQQLGTTGESKRTDTGGLLLISPPGYGKTTLMEYVADRLGMILVKVNGPALGHAVTSLDPAEAPNATARQEVEKINFALEAGNNTLLYLDDIQPTSPELLQKFIPLCDATRRIEWELHPGYVLRPEDRLVLATTRQGLAELLGRHPRSADPASP
jgi:MoxR-like ATPase